MAKLGTIFNSLALKAGILASDPALVGILSKAELANQEIPDDLATKIEEGLFNLDSAKQNGKLKAHFTGLALNGLDAELERLATQEELEEGDITELKAETNSFKKAGILAEKIKAKTAKLGQGSKKDDDKLRQEITNLNAQLKAEKEARATDLAKQQAETVAKIQALHEKQLMASMPYTNKDLPLEANINNLMFFTNQKLAELKGKVKYDIETGTFKLVQQADESLDLYDQQNNLMKYEDLVKGVGIQHKLVAVADPKGPQPPAKIDKPGDDPKQPGGTFFDAVESDIQHLSTTE